MGKKTNENNQIKKETKTMSKENTRPQEPKTAKTVEVKVALPWTILVLATAIIASLIAGWNLRSNDMNRVTAEAHSIVELTKAPSKE